LISPFLPDTSKKLCDFLQIQPVAWEKIGSASLLTPGHKINKSGLLFEKIEDDTIQKQLDKLQKTKELNAAKNKTVKPQKESITYDQFSTMDIRIGTILAAERVPKTQKTDKLTIDTELIHVLSFRHSEFFEPEKIVGRQVNILIISNPKN
jgi:methionyl-tRNA synthetase